MHWHLAQVNVAHAREDLDHPLMSSFTERIPEVNALSDAAPGFVWRWQESDAVYARPLDDPRLLFNLTVWESPEALRRFVYSAEHAEVMRDRARWFTRHPGPSLALWWIPAGTTPSTEGAVARLEYLRRAGETPAAFTFAGIPEPPPAAPALDLDGRVFVLRENTPNGEVDAATVFRYRQETGLVWADYSGGAIRSGRLIARFDQGALEAVYEHVNNAGDRRTGVCRTTPERLPDGRLRLLERWRWTSGDGSPGESVVEEIEPATAGFGRR